MWEGKNKRVKTTKLKRFVSTMIIKKLVSRRNHAVFLPYSGVDELTESETSDQTDSGENQSGNWAMINSHN